MGDEEKTQAGGQQEDAEEFLGFFLDPLEEELLALDPAVMEEEDKWLEVGRKNRAVVTRTIKEVESPISRIFGGKFRSTLRAAGQKDSVIIEAWRTLRLDTQRDAIHTHTIQDALSFIAHPQAVHMGAADASLQILIGALPPLLGVAFGPELEIGGGESSLLPSLCLKACWRIVEYVDVLGPTVTKSRKPVRYTLFAAVYQRGVSAAGGHYTLDVSHAAREWVRIDDEPVSDVRAEDVFGVEREREEGRCAYFLFYRRVR
ncbi:hypothetical protein DFH09DRAFT_1472270 [Mycena vulgaris]|nr:hypothetical protein DFH09DRAFT_1472270 [Mycena vulgaris]